VARWLLFAALAGCGHPAPPAGSHALARAPSDAAPPPDAAALDDDLPRLATRSAQLYQELAASLGSAADCAAAADQLAAIETSYADVIAANTRVAHLGGDKAVAYRQALEPHHDAFAAAAAAIAGSSIARQCAHDDRFTAAMDRLGGAP
jgi:hypothetical protein